MANLTQTPTTLLSALSVLGNKNSVKIGNNTKLEKSGANVIATLHGHTIVEYTEDATLATWAGYATSTTRDRLNQLTNGRFNIKGGVPHLNGEPVSARGYYEV